MMNLQYTMPNGERLELEEHDGQTNIGVQSGHANSQQSQRTGFDTGAWTHPPTLFQSQNGLILRVEGHAQHYFAIGAGSTRRLDSAPDLREAEVLTLERNAATPPDTPAMEPMKPLEPMKPMEPMRPMKPLEPMKPMEMRLGSMHMSMNDQSDDAAKNANTGKDAEAAKETPEAGAQSQAKARFCTQCGVPARQNDKFCGACGAKLRDA